MKEPPTVYEFKVEGLIDNDWSEWFDGMKITHMSASESVMTGELADQTALQGMLAKIRDLGLKLISVRRIDESQQHDSA